MSRHHLNSIAFVVTMVAWATCCRPADGVTCSPEHPFHFSMAEIEYIPESSTFEIAVCLFVDDLQTAVRKDSKSQVVLESDEKTDIYLRDYVKDRFAISQSSNGKSELSWVGHECAGQQIWIYFEIGVEGKKADSKTSDSKVSFTVRNELLFDQFPNQTNHAVVKSGQQKQALLFSFLEPSQDMDLNSAEK